MCGILATVIAAAVGFVVLAAGGSGVAAAKGRNTPVRFPPLHVPQFVGKIKTIMMSDGRHMKLLAPYSYIDKDYKVWTAPKGAITDGASIPKFFWSVIGGPFEGKYRGPSILHDWYCDRRTRPWKDVDRMFFRAMLTAGVNRLKAQIMYAAVLAYGPKWGFQTIQNERLQNDITSLLGRYGQTRHANTAVLSQGFGLVHELKHKQVETLTVPSNELWRLRRANLQTKQDFTQVFRGMVADAKRPGSSAMPAPSREALSLLKGEGVITDMGPVVRLAVPIISPQATPVLAKRLEREAGARPMTEADLEKLADSLVRSR